MWYFLIMGSIILYRISCYTVILEGVSTVLMHFNVLISNLCFVNESALYEFIFYENATWCDITFYHMIHHVMLWKFLLYSSQWLVIVFHSVDSQVRSIACIKYTSFNIWAIQFVWNFNGYLWNSTPNISPIHGKVRFFFTKCWKFKSSQAYVLICIFERLTLVTKQNQDL